MGPERGGNRVATELRANVRGVARETSSVNAAGLSPSRALINVLWLTYVVVKDAHEDARATGMSIDKGANAPSMPSHKR